MATVEEVVDAFEYLYTNLLDPEYARSTKYGFYKEQELLPLTRAFLLGYFADQMQAEHWSTLPGCPTKYGRIDFVVGGVAVELAVRKRGTGKRHLMPTVNVTEVKKLLCWKGKAVLILFDFDDDHLGVEDIKEYRELPSLGKGRWKKSPFNVAYFYRAGKPREVSLIRRRVRARRLAG
jgi:hypothetical protein